MVIVMKYICAESEQRTLGAFKEQIAADTLLSQQYKMNAFA